VECEAIVMLSILIGAISLARAADDTELSKRILSVTSSELKNAHRT
jgi:hypothetical protein